MTDNVQVPEIGPREAGPEALLAADRRLSLLPPGSAEHQAYFSREWQQTIDGRKSQLTHEINKQDAPEHSDLEAGA